MYCELIDSLFITRLIVSANISAMLSCFTFAHFLAYGMLSVNTISVSPDSCTRKEAGSDITQWLAIARTDLAPASHDIGSFGDCSCCIYDIIDQYYIFVFHVTDDLHGSDFVGFFT